MSQTQLVLRRAWWNPDDGPALLTSLDPQTDRKRIIQARHGDVDEASEWINKEMAIVHILAHPADLPDDKTGEVRQGVRCVLILDSGAMVAAWSPTVIDHLRTVCDYYGPPPWDPPYRVTLRRVQSSRNAGQSYYRLDPVD